MTPPDSPENQPGSGAAARLLDPAGELPTRRGWARLAAALVLLLPLVLTIYFGILLSGIIAWLLVACMPPATMPSRAGNNDISWWPHITLLILAGVSAVAWAAEVWVNLPGGWGQLTIEYRSRWAVPGCYAAFILWTLCVVRVSRPMTLAAALAAYMVAVWLGLEAVYHNFYLVTGMELGTWGLAVYPSLYFLWSMVPQGFCAICRWFGMRIGLQAALFSGMALVLSWPLSGIAWLSVRLVGVMRMELVSMLTNGSLTPFLVISLGLPILAARHAADAKLAAELPPSHPSEHGHMADVSADSSAHCAPA